MKNSEMQTQKILNYLYGEMNNHEKIQFEQELTNHEELRKELLLQQAIDNAILKEIKVDKFKAALTKIHENEISKKEGKILNLQNKWYWAAASITIFSGTAIYSLKTHFQNPDRLFDTYYQVWQPSVITRGADSEQFTKNIIKNFEDGQFSKVIELLEKMQIEKTLNPKLILLKGCAEMELLDYTSALETFAIFDSKDYTFYTEAGQWYQALCYLKVDDVEKSKQMLISLIERKTSYAIDANALLEKLNQ